MRVSRLGEFGMIERIRRAVKTDSSVIKGIEDDCAVLKLNATKYQLFTCDMLIEGIDFLPQEKPYLVGRKALAVSLSDIAACAGTPRYCLVSLGLPRDTSVAFVDRLLKGMLDIAAKFHVNIVGGDLSRSSRIAIDVSMLGIVDKKRLVLRNGAKSGDIIFVTGKLGGSTRGKHLRFTPRVKESGFLTNNFKINAMIDISDGLAQDLGHILKESRAGAILYEELIPFTKEARNLNDALYTGEDFELLFTVTRKEARRILARKLSWLKPIGEIVGKQYNLRLIDRKGRGHILEPKGFRHF